MCAWCTTVATCPCFCCLIIPFCCQSSTPGFSILGTALDWFHSSRTQSFVHGGHQTDDYPVCCSVSLGSVLGPLEFIVYTIKQHAVHSHSYTDDSSYMPVPLPMTFQVFANVTFHRFWNMATYWLKIIVNFPTLLSLNDISFGIRSTRVVSNWSDERYVSERHHRMAQKEVET